MSTVATSTPTATNANTEYGYNSGFDYGYNSDYPTTIPTNSGKTQGYVSNSIDDASYSPSPVADSTSANMATPIDYA